ncbi:MAG: TolC family protein [Planctomycetes bacterium]|nr:TolC family protein [Planctomycetota bacterium]
MINTTHFVKPLTALTLTLLVSFLDPGVSISQAVTKTNSFNLGECIRIAIENNLQIETARKKLGTAEADRIKASLLFPSNPRLNSRIGSRNSPSPAGRHTDYMISLSQEFQVYGQRKRRLSVSNKKIERVKYEIADVERHIISAVKMNYYEVLAAGEILALRKKGRHIFEKLWKATRERFNAGAISVLEFNSIKIGFGQARQRLLVAESNYQKSLMNMKLLLGKSDDREINIEGKLHFEKLQINKKNLLDSAFKTRPDLMAVELEKERATQEVSLRKVEIIPNPRLTGFFSREEGSDDIVGGQVSISIPVWDRKQSELKRAKSDKDTAVINKKYKQMQIQKEVETAYQTFTAAKDGIAIYTDDIIPEVDESLNLNEISYNEGNISFVEFLTMQKNFLEIRTAYLITLLDYNKAVTNLETVSGENLILNDR